MLRNDGLWKQVLAAGLAKAARRIDTGQVEVLVAGNQPGAVAASRAASALLAGESSPVILKISAGATVQPKPQEDAMERPQEAIPMIGVITALPKEFAAVQVLLTNPHDRNIPGRGAGRRYTLGNVSAAGGGWHRVVLALMTDMGNNIAAVRQPFSWSIFKRWRRSL